MTIREFAAIYRALSHLRASYQATAMECQIRGDSQGANTASGRAYTVDEAIGAVIEASTQDEVTL